MWLGRGNKVARTPPLMRASAVKGDYIQILIFHKYNARTLKIRTMVTPDVNFTVRVNKYATRLVVKTLKGRRHLSKNCINAISHLKIRKYIKTQSAGAI